MGSIFRGNLLHVFWPSHVLLEKATLSTMNRSKLKLFKNILYPKESSKKEETTTNENSKETTTTAILPTTTTAILPTTQATSNLNSENNPNPNPNPNEGIHNPIQLNPNQLNPNPNQLNPKELNEGIHEGNYPPPNPKSSSLDQIGENNKKEPLSSIGCSASSLQQSQSLITDPTDPIMQSQSVKHSQSIDFVEQDEEEEEEDFDDYKKGLELMMNLIF